MVRSVSLVRVFKPGSASAGTRQSAELSCLLHQRRMPFPTLLLEDIAADEQVGGSPGEISRANPGGAPVGLSKNVRADAGSHARHDHNATERFNTVRPEVDCLRVNQM